MMAGQMRLHRKGLMLLPQVTMNDKGMPGVMETLPAEVTTIDLLNCAIRTAPGEKFAAGRAWPRMAGTLLRRVLRKQQPGNRWYSLPEKDAPIAPRLRHAPAPEIDGAPADHLSLLK